MTRARLRGAIFQPVDLSRVTITDSFWKPKMEKVATTTFAAFIIQTEEKTPRIRNFEKVARGQGEKQEDYYAGHLIEAAVACYRTTGKRKLLDVAIRFADHFDSNLRQADRQEQMLMGNNLIAAAR